MTLTTAELNHYQRQMILPQFGREGQERLKRSRVLVVGAGGLGSPVSLYLAAAGVGHLGLVDDDCVDASNLHRQVLYTADDLQKPKVACAADRLRRMNPHIEIIAHRLRLDSSNALHLLRDQDVIVDGSDNFATRYLVNDACVLLGKPLVYGSIYQFEGQASVFHHQGGPCYRCLFPEPPPAQLAPSCAEAGVLGVLPAVIASIQATEVVKLITGIGRTLSGRLLHYNAAQMSFYEMQLARDSACPVCGDHPTITTLELKGSEPFNQCVAEGIRGETDKRALTPFMLKGWMEEEAITLIDVREDFEREICSIADSIHVPLAQVEKRMEEFRDRGKLVIYCKTGGRSSQAAQQFRQAGFADVYSLEGGILAWADQVDPEMPRY